MSQQMSEPFNGIVKRTQNSDFVWDSSNVAKRKSITCSRKTAETQIISC